MLQYQLLRESTYDYRSKGNRWQSSPCYEVPNLANRLFVDDRPQSIRHATTSTTSQAILMTKAVSGFCPITFGTMVENGKKHRQNSHPIFHCPTSERCERTSERASEWPSTSVCILGCYRPQCLDHTILSQDYDIVGHGTQRGLCPKPIGFCGVEPEVGQTAPAPDRDECEARDKDITILLNNVLVSECRCCCCCC